MYRYTRELDEYIYSLNTYDDNYEEGLIKIAQTFSTFSEAFPIFLCQHGFNGHIFDFKGMSDFLDERFKSHGINKYRDFYQVFIESKKVKRDIAFKICFSLDLNLEQTKQFFKKVYFDRPFDCHDVNEAVYYYCFLNGYNYKRAQEILSKLPKIKQKDMSHGADLLYTGAIISFIHGISDDQQLIDYICQHETHFAYNHATATKYISELWEEISKENGLCYQEGIYYSKEFDYIPKINQSIEDEKLDTDCFTVVSKKDSTWRIIAQILGLDLHWTNILASDRSVKLLLEHNILVPELLKDSFPSRDGIEKCIRGSHLSHERIRKILILLSFYIYWAKIVVKNQDEFIVVGVDDSEKCIDLINTLLLEAGYDELYAGNPYDWIFMWASQDEQPLMAFRYYMGELYAMHKSKS